MNSEKEKKDDTLTVEVPKELAINVLAILEITKTNYVQALGRELLKVYGFNVEDDYDKTILGIDKIVEDITVQLNTIPKEGE